MARRDEEIGGLESLASHSQHMMGIASLSLLDHAPEIRKEFVRQHGEQIRHLSNAII